MTDSASFDLIMNGVDNGATGVIDNVAGSTADLNKQLTELAKKEKAEQQLKELKIQLQGMTKAEKEALIATDAQARALENLADKSAKVGMGTKAAGFSMTEFNAAMQVGKQVLAALDQGYDATIGKSQAYAHTIRDVSQITGQGAEATSRMIQVFDDFEIGADDITTAMRKMTTNGLVPNFETIQKLATEYQAIQDPLAKNKFLVDNLGRASAGYSNLLSQETDALQRNFDSVDKKLIMTAEDIRASEELRLVQDALKDSIDGLAIAAGKNLVPALKGVIDFVQGGVDGFNMIVDGVTRYNEISAKMVEILKEQGLGLMDYTSLTGQAHPATRGLTEATQDQITAAHDLAIQQLDLAASTDDVVVAMDPVAPTLEEITAKNKALSDVYVTIMGIQSQIVSQQNSYTQSSADLTAQQEALRVKMAELVSQGWPATSEKVMQLQGQYDELGVRAGDLAVKNDIAMKQIAANAADAKLAVDGWTAAEFQASQQIKVGLDLITQAQADQAVKMNELTTALANGQISVEQFNQAVTTGSLEVKTKTEESSNSWELYAGQIKKNTDETAVVLDGGITKVADYADVTKNKTDSVAEGWQTAAVAVEASVNDGIGNIQRYIDMIQKVPTDWNTNFTQTGTPPTGTNESFGAGMLGGGTNIYIQNAWIDRDNQISQMAPMLVVG